MATFRFYVTQTNDLEISITADSLEDARDIFENDVITDDMECMASEWQEIGAPHEVTA